MEANSQQVLDSEQVLEDRRDDGGSAVLAGTAARAGWRRLVPFVPTFPSTSARDSLERRFLIVADMLAATAALVVFISLLGDDALTLTAFAALPIVVLISKVDGLYDRDDMMLRKTTLDEVPKLFRLATLFALVIWLLEDILLTGQLGDEQVLGIWMGFFGAIVIAAGVCQHGGQVGAAAGALHRSRRPLLRPADPREARAQPGHRRRGLRRAAADAAARRRCGRRGLGVERRLDRRGRSSLRRPPHPVAPDRAEGEAVLDLVRMAKASRVKVTIVPRVLEVIGSEIESDDLDGMTVLAVRHSDLTRSSKALKRGFDLFGAGLILTVMFPLMLLIAIAVRLDSRGLPPTGRPASGAAATLSR